ncbi:hypothetical protein JCM3775_005746 [Rhodotorula graminis]
MANIVQTWTANRSSRLAAQAVLDQFLPAHRTPAQLDTFVVGGLAALACHVAPAPHGQLVVNALRTAKLATQDTTNLFFARDPEGQQAVRGHLKVLPLIFRPHQLRQVAFGGDVIRHAAWEGVVAGELLLGADAECPAPLMVIRWALLLGIDEVRALHSDVHHDDRDELVHSHVAVAVRDMIPVEHRAHVVTRWLAKLNNDYRRSAVDYEWRTSAENESRVARERRELAYASLGERFKEVINSLRAILIVHPPGAHSLDKSAFDATARRRDERVSVFV